MRILLVEDDQMIAHSLSAALRDAAYTIDSVSNARHANAALAAQPYDLILLDLTLPDGDGLAILQQLRERGQTQPVLIITARDGLDDRINGLDLGADDFLVKPFNLEELLARIRALLRRAAGQASGLIGNGCLRLDPHTRTALPDNTAPVPLSKKEYLLLQALLLNQGRILSRAALEDKLYGFGEEIESNAIDYLIHSLRKKIGNQHIKNIRGAGWMVPS